MTNPQAPTDDLVRFTPLSEARAAEEGSTLVGYATPFNTWTEIDSWEGKFRERFSKGAFDKTLKDNGDRIKVLFNHGFDPMIGDKPLGKPRTMKPDNKGLWTETPLDDTSYNSDIKASLASGALDGMSIRFSVVKETWEDSDEIEMPERTILEARLYEFGPVTFPAYEAATAGIRNRAAFQAWRQTHPEAAGTSTEAASTPDEGAGGTSPDEAARTSPSGTPRLDKARIQRRKRELQCQS